MKFLLPVFSWCLLMLFLSKCANPLTPSGGPRDTIPPYLISSQPASQELNYEGRTLKMEFSEFIATEQLLNNLTITPNQDIKYTQLAKKNILTLKLDKDLQDSTTYIFNFFNGVTDITEKNPVENLIIPFSTGDYIDSINVSGKLSTLWDQQLAKDITVGLYLHSDSLDFTQTKPTYFIKTDELGEFKLTNLKVNQYQLLAFSDINNNLIFDPKEESHASLVDSFFLQSDLDSLDLQLVQLNPYPPKKLSSRPLSNYYQIRYDRDILTYEITPADTAIQLYSKIEEERESIRVYPNSSVVDSLLTYVTVYDTLQNQATDTIYIQFNESNRKQSDFTYSFPSKPVNIYDDTLRLSVSFNKPVETFRTDSINIKADSLYTQNLNTQDFQLRFNYSQTRATITIPFDWQAYEDTVKNIITRTIPDSVVNVEQLSINTLTLNLPSGLFRSIEGDTTSTKSILYIRKQPPQGVIRYDLLITSSSFKVQLIDKNYNTLREIDSQKSGAFSALPAGTYSLRVLIDENNDGKWQNTNFPQFLQHEPVYVFPEFTQLRDNWEINLGSGPINTGY